MFMVSVWFGCIVCFFFVKQKTAYEMRISDWSSDVCSSDLTALQRPPSGDEGEAGPGHRGLEPVRYPFKPAPSTPHASPPAADDQRTSIVSPARMLRDW